MGEAEVLISGEALPEGGLVRVRTDDLTLALARVGGSVYALTDRCPHLGCPLTKGSLEGFILTCPCHDWRFDVRDGRFVDAPEISVETHEIHEDGGYIRASRQGTP